VSSVDADYQVGTLFDFGSIEISVFERDPLVEEPLGKPRGIAREDALFLILGIDIEEYSKVVITGKCGMSRIYALDDR
jgi:hypothetical protein